MKRLPAIPLFLLVLSLWDLRTEMQLMLDHFTFSGLAASVVNHPLAIGVLVVSPVLFRQFR